MTRTTLLAAILLGLTDFRLALADKPAPVAPATMAQVQHAVDRAIGYLQTESASWLKTRKCAACHHAGMPLWALNEAGRMGYAIDKKFVADALEGSLGRQDKMIAARLVPGPKDPPDTRPLGRGLNVGLVFLAVAARSSPVLSDGQKQSLRWISDQTLKLQMKDGSWEFFLSRPPINETPLTDNIWIIMALQSDTQADASQAQRAALQKSLDWLAATKWTDTYQSKVLKLLVAIRGGKIGNALQSGADELLSLQQADGGWRQLPEMKSDAFATGQTLYVLALAGYTTQRPEIKRAIDFLVTSQKSDGSWPMTSRATPDGRPGSARLLTPITCGATSWAALGLSRLVPKG